MTAKVSRFVSYEMTFLRGIAGRELIQQITSFWYKRFNSRERAWAGWRVLLYCLLQALFLSKGRELGYPNGLGKPHLVVPRIHARRQVGMGKNRLLEGRQHKRRLDSFDLPSTSNNKLCKYGQKQAMAREKGL